MAGPFPATRRSVVLASRDPDPEVRRTAFAVLVESYWKPVYKYLRVKWQTGEEEAQDLTQSFFLATLEKGTFDRYDPARARFRTFLRTCLDGFAVNEHRAAQRLKRGGGAVPLSLDFAGAEEELAHQGLVDPINPEEYFHREWVRALFARSVEELRRRCGRPATTGVSPCSNATTWKKIRRGPPTPRWGKISASRRPR